MNAVINGPTHTAINGDTIIIPAGTCSWTSGVTVSAAITIKGSGTPNNTPSTFGPGTLTTSISSAISGGASPLFNVTGLTQGQFFHLSTINFAAQTSPGAPSGAPAIQILGGCNASGCTNIRLDNLNFGSTWNGANLPQGSIVITNNVLGVVDHNATNGAHGAPPYFINANLGNWKGTGQYGDNSWATADTFGGADAMYIENNIFNSGAASEDDADLVGGLTGAGGGRFVCRFNEYLDVATSATSCGGHGTSTTGRPRGMRQTEVYNNSFHCTDGGGCYGPIGYNSGSGYVFDNTWSVGSGSFFNGYISLAAQRLDAGSWPPWGQCNGSDGWDLNSGGVPVACLDQPGRGQGNLISGSTPSPVAWPSEALTPIYEWGDAQTGGFTSPVQNGSSTLNPNHDYYNENTNQTAQSSATSPFNGTTTIGVGHGTLANRPTTCTTGVAYWATDQGSWNTSGSGGQGQLYKCTSTNTWTLSYTPYIYPNPLITGGGATFALTATVSGSGLVTGMSCASGTYASGTLIGACTATPSAGSTFTGWTGTGSASGCTGTGTCGPFTLSANSTITATFALVAHTLSTATAGTGSGTITGCAGSYFLGDPYTCTVTPASGSTISSVTGCGGSGTTTYAGAFGSSNCTVTATFQGTAGTPASSPVAGSYSTPQRVALTTTTAGAVIHYTVDGSTPTSASPVYTHKLYVTQSQTLKALAIAAGWTNSGVGSSAYVIAKAKTRFSLTPTSSSSIPVPYPPDLRSCCGSNVAALETARGTYNLTSLHNWISAALAHSSTFTYTIQGFPAWMTGLGGVESAPPTDLHVTAACQNVLTGTTTTDCTMKELITKLMMDRTGLSSQPANPATCSNLDYLEMINEFNTDDTGGSTGWTGTYADLAVLANDISQVTHNWCSNTVVVAGSASAIVGFHANGENAHYDIALQVLLADWTGISNASLPDAISFHGYPARQSVIPAPFPPSNINHGATCTSTSCYIAVKDEVNQLNTSATLQSAAVVAWAKFLPIYSTEGGFGTVAQLGGTSITTIGAGYVAQSMMAIAAQNPVNHMFYAADDPTWGCYWNCGSGNSAWLFAYNQMLSWLNANAITGTLTSSAITGGNKWTLQLDSGAAELDFCDAWLTSCTASTSFNSVTTLSGVTTSTGGSVTLTQEPSLLFNAGTVATPTFAPAAGSYGSAQNVTISDSTAGATICYTTDGSTPTSSPVGTCSHGTTYSTPVSVSSSLTLSAIGTQAGSADSGVGSAAYVIAAATPTFSPVAGAYGTAQSVTISDTTPSSTIYYTTDGSTPTTGSTVYSTPIAVASTTTVKAIAAAAGHANSSVGTALYTINGTVATPTFSPVAGTYAGTQAIGISTSTSSAVICWTSDGSTPTANGAGVCTHGTTYTGLVTVSASLTLKAVGTKSGFTDSSAGSAAYVITAPSIRVTLTGAQTFSGNVTIH